MRYTGPKFKLCRREWINLFWTPKYDVRKRRGVPWQHGANMPRLSEYGKMLRNKQVLKRSYMMGEKQFKNLIVKTAQKYSKNSDTPYDQSVLLFLERRMDVIVWRAGFAHTIMQARQMVWHGHFLLNWSKHNIPSTFVSQGDVIKVKDSLVDSPLYQSSPLVLWWYKPSAWLKVTKKSYTVEVVDLPHVETIETPSDVLKVIEFYAR